MDDRIRRSYILCEAAAARNSSALPIGAVLELVAVSDDTSHTDVLVEIGLDKVLHRAERVENCCSRVELEQSEPEVSGVEVLMSPITVCLSSIETSLRALETISSLVHGLVLT